MVSTVPTIEGSFKQKLCRPLIYEKENYRTDHIPSGPVQNVPAPKFVRFMNPEDLFGIARKILPLYTSNVSLQERMPQDEASLCIVTEADVAAIARLSLLHPVNIAATAALIKKNGRLECRQERTVGTTRPDTTWVYVDSNNNEKTIAILEYKNTSILRRSDFNQAGVSTSVEAIDMMKWLSKANKDTKLEHNARSVSKQARNYSQKGGTPDVAVFDWKSMVVYDFSIVSETLESPSPTLLTWFSETGTNYVDSGNMKTFRALLLGFLLRALKRHGLA